MSLLLSPPSPRGDEADHLYGKLGFQTTTVSAQRDQPGTARQAHRGTREPHGFCSQRHPNALLQKPQITTTNQKKPQANSRKPLSRRQRLTERSCGAAGMGQAPPGCSPLTSVSPGTKLVPRASPGWFWGMPQPQSPRRRTLTTHAQEEMGTEDVSVLCLAEVVPCPCQTQPWTTELQSTSRGEPWLADFKLIQEESRSDLISHVHLPGSATRFPNKSGTSPPHLEAEPPLSLGFVKQTV